MTEYVKKVYHAHDVTWDSSNVLRRSAFRRLHIELCFVALLLFPNETHARVQN